MHHTMFENNCSLALALDSCQLSCVNKPECWWWQIQRIGTLKRVVKLWTVWYSLVHEVIDIIDMRQHSGWITLSYRDAQANGMELWCWAIAAFRPFANGEPALHVMYDGIWQLFFSVEVPSEMSSVFRPLPVQLWCLWKQLAAVTERPNRPWSVCRDLEVF